MSERVCVDCGAPLLEMRGNPKRCAGCRSAHNAAMNRAAVKAWHKAHPEKKSAYNHAHYRHHATQISAYNARYYQQRNDLYCADCMARLNDQTCWCNLYA